MRPVSAAILCLLFVSTTAAGQAEFDPTLSIFGTERGAHCLAVADFDRDGDLDVVVGEGKGASLWLNHNGVMTQSSWNPVPALRNDLVQSVAVGDLNQDGFVDVVVGTTLWVKMFENIGGTLSNAATSSVALSITSGIALGDVDGDGDLDIVCANGNESVAEANTVYRNDGGLLPAHPEWIQVDTPSRSSSVALADVDGDGLVDAVFGNLAEPNRLYLGDAAGLLASTFSWEDLEARQTRGVALGDLDGDSILDLVCANSTQPVSMHLGVGGAFSSTADWRASILTYGRGNGVALGDVDRDGDLDIAIAKGTRSEVYLNRSTVLDTLPAWGVDVWDWQPQAVALADLDGDGDLEFILVRVSLINHGTAGFYSNMMKPYSAVPDWATTVAKDTRDVELVDIDGDRDLELVLAHYEDPNEMYSFDEGTYSLSWTSDHGFPTTDAATGDMDNDGDADLLCSTYGGNRDFALVYRNESGTLSPDTVWSVRAGGITMREPTCVAWGDFQGDGFPEAVVGTGQLYSEVVYRNPGGVLESANPLLMQLGPAALLAHEWAPFDVDLDGDLDIVGGGKVGNQAGFVLFVNNGGTMHGYSDVRRGSGGWGLATGYLDGDDYIDVVVAAGGSWISWNRDGVPGAAELLAAESHWGIRTGDIDGDGDVDVMGIRSTANESWVDVYRNSSSPGLSSAAESMALSRGHGTSLALRDIDLDGDLDIVVASGGLPGGTAGDRGITSVHMARRTPAFLGDPESPTNQLPANSAILRDVRAREIAINTWELEFALYDVESDPVNVAFEYQYEGDGRWRPMVLPSPPGLLASAPTGVTHTVAWDVTELRVPGRHAVSIRLHATNVQSVVGASAQHVSRYVRTLEVIKPQRPSMDIVTAQASFPTVTVGDTVSAQVVVRNLGNLQLVMGAVDLPSPFMAITDSLTTIPPGGQDTLRVAYMPVADPGSLEDLTIHGNDPNNPALPVPVGIDVRELRGTTHLWTSAPELPIDENVIAEFTPLNQVHVDGGHIFHRAAGAAAFTDSVEMSPSGATFLAVIPAEALFEAGLEYYVRVENSGVFDTDPQGAPATFFGHNVAPPAGVVAAALPNDGPSYAQGAPVTVEATLPPGSMFERGWVYYREGATAGFDTLGMTGSGDVARAEVPGAVAGVRGIEFWIEVETISARLFAPPVEPQGNPYTIQTTLANLSDLRIHPDMHYRLFSFPADVLGTAEGAVVDNLGRPDKSKWRLFRYTGDRYVDVESIPRFETGEAYWLMSRDPYRLDTAPEAALSTDTSVPFEIELRSGWNLVGNPFPFDVAWDSVIPGDTTAVRWPPIGYTGPISAPYYAEVSVLEPFSGYWVYNDADSVVSIWIPPVEGPPAPRLTPPPELAWAVNVTASSEDARARSLILAVSEKATDKHDRFDRLLPPAVPESSLDLYAIDDRGSSLSRDVRTASMLPGWGHTWAFDVAVSKNGRVPVTLGFDFDSVPEAAEVLLLDREVKRTLDLGSLSQIEVFITGGARKTSPDDTRFVLLVGGPLYIEEHRSLLPGLPTRTALRQNFPNPFNPTTVIRYELAGAARVSLKVYDVRGALVRTLEDRNLPAGRYEVGWDATDNRGSSVASGIYFYRLVSSEGVTLTKKMALLK